MMSYIESQEFRSKAEAARAKMQRSREAMFREMFDADTAGIEKVQTPAEFLDRLNEEKA